MSANFLNQNGVRFSIKRLPTTSFYASRATLPGLSITPVMSPNPFHKLKVPGDTMEYDELNLTFRCDENMENYNEIMNWMIGLSFPEEFDQFANLVEGDGLYSDATVTILNSKQIPNIEYRFKNIWPMNLGSVEFDTTNEDVEYAECDVTFAVESFEYYRL